MYDVGKILAVGGSPAYQDALATANAHIITIGSPGSAATVQTINSMYQKRIFATSTVLPDGSVFIVGGQSYGVPFSDANSSMIPELWSPSTTRFTQMAQQPEARNYHSISVLMPDATVFTGGGGLCGDCSTNHFTGQVFSPPYLFGSDGTTLATRPTISSVSATTIKVGGSFSVKLGSSSGTITFSIVRYGSSTHTINTDQRRIPLTPTSTSGTTYNLRLPSDAGKVLPGAWYLFAMRNGVPSVAKTIWIQL
jgi:galactose oxidase